MNYTEEVRKFIMQRILLGERLSGEKSDSIEIAWRDIALKERNSTERIIANYMNRNIEIKDLFKSNIMSVLSIIQMYTDYYILKRNEGEDDFYVENYNELKKKFINLKYARKLFGSTLLMLELTEFEKIIKFRNLNEKDIEFLSNFNVLFEEEKNKYYKKITLEDLLKEIDFLQNKLDFDKELSYFYTSTFLFELYEFDKENVILLIKNIMNEISNDLFIENYTDDKYIEVDGMRMDDSILAALICEIYVKYQSKNIQTKSFSMKNIDLK